ncbi:MAG TPA: hypothetical protein DDW30_07905 [Clostridiales bacterium]|nr:hypothetical protein [Clostridiales bacterium]
MKKNQLWSILPSLLLSAALLGSCAQTGNGGNGTNNSDSTNNNGGAITDDSTVTTVPIDTTAHNYAFVSQDGDSYTYRCDDCGESATVTVKCESGTAGCAKVEGNTLTLSGMTEDSVYSLSGVFYGNIVVEGNEACKIELELQGVTVNSAAECPLTVSGADEVTISAKKGTDNYLCDLREAVTDEDAISAAVWTDCDLKLQGKGNLYVSSVANNGIHTKDDLKVKNLFLQVECEDNALKGNDSVTIESGTLILIARTGDGIKTTNSDLSSKGKQRGTVAITGGDVRIYAACDGIDAAYDVTVDESSATVNLTVFTDKYSKYSKEVNTADESILYLRTTTSNYRYSLYFYDDKGGTWCNAESAKSMGNSRYSYYTVTKPSGYEKCNLYVYTSDQTQGQKDSYYAAKEDITLNDNYDTIAISFGTTMKLTWTTYSTAQGGMGGQGGPGGMGGMNDGNTDKGDRSTKGLKAANAITISAGTVTVESYDDSIHANNDTTPENGAAATGNVTVTGGTLTLSSCDDAIHADGAVTISGGTVNVLKSYEGIEGTTVTLAGGDITVVSSDDGVNGTGTSGTSIVISGGTLYVLAGGDGVDSNSRDSYGGILFAGGRSVIISTGRADSSIDTEAGYTYEGGYVVAIGLAGGMSTESTHCSPSLTSIGTSKSVTLTAGSYLTVSGVVTVKAPTAMNALVICLGKTNASILAGTTGGGDADVVWSVAG